MFHFRRQLLYEIKNRCVISTAITQVYLVFLQNQTSPKSISSTNTNTNTNTKKFTVSYLMNSCGLSPESSLSVSKRVQIKTAENPNSVLELFRNHGFTKTQITKLITMCPSILFSNPEKTLKPKIEYFDRCGISRSDLTNILSSNPSVLKLSLKNQIIPSFDYLKSVVDTNENVTAALKRSTRLLQRSLKSVMEINLSILRDHGVEESKILKLLTTQPRMVILSEERFSEIVEFVKKMGFNPNSSNFILAIRVMSGMSKSNWKRKVATYQSLGWSEDEFLLAFRVQPMCMVTSEEKIRKIAAFILNEMGWNMSMISRCPNLLLCSLEKRIVPRCSILRILMSKGLIKEENLIWGLNVCEKIFLERFVFKNQEIVPEILSVYQGKVGSGSVTYI